MTGFTHAKIEIFIPEEYVETLREALHKAGAGQIGDYDHCCSVHPVQGYWRPLEGAEPFLGRVGEVMRAQECKVEVNCRRERIGAALEAIRQVHPYEEPVINVIPLANHLFEKSTGT